MVKPDAVAIFGVLLAASVLLSGCTDDGTDAVASAAPAPVASLAFGSPSHVAADGPHSSPDVVTAIRALSEFTDASAAESWAVADRQVRDLLGREHEVALHYREQMAGFVMLRHHLLDAAPGDEQLEALGYYTQLLIQNRSPQAPQIADALDRLAGHWPEERIREAARTTAVASEEHLASTIGCDGCAYAELQEAIGADTYGQEVRLLSAIQRLHSMSR